MSDSNSGGKRFPMENCVYEMNGNLNPNACVKKPFSTGAHWYYDQSPKSLLSRPRPPVWSRAAQIPALINSLIISLRRRLNEREVHTARRPCGFTAATARAVEIARNLCTGDTRTCCVKLAWTKTKREQ